MEIDNQPLHLSFLKDKQVSLSIKREDLIHPFISGNKYRKLKYNIVAAKSRGFDTLLTFGGAFSNHIAAAAYAGKLSGIKTIGIIRGEELAEKWSENPTLKLASAHGMQLKFVDRITYRNKENLEVLSGFKEEFGQYYLLPEGGTNSLAIRGCEEILTHQDTRFDYVCCAVGTGGTLSGIINASNPDQQVLGFPALKGDFLNEDIRKFVRKENWALQPEYHFGGYAKVSRELIDFINDFKLKTHILLDPIYTGKMLFGLFDMIKNDYFVTGTSILAVHTGGLQGISGMNTVLQKKNLPLIAV